MSRLIQRQSILGLKNSGAHRHFSNDDRDFRDTDFHKDFCATKLKLNSKQSLTDEQLEHFAEIISWNIWQMDGLKYVIPMSCRQTIQKPLEVSKDQLSLGLVAAEKSQKIKIECEGCRLNHPLLHSGKYAKIMDWDTHKTTQFVKLLNHV